ncbi:DUF2713 family protein, partial [Escherichia coli]|nr:DUF2713 family protein [Escherichia coli]
GKNSLNRLIRCVCGKKSAQIREILISESAWEEMTCLFAPSLANIHFQAIGSGFLTFVNACQEHDDNSLKLFASLLISLSYSSAYADLSETVYINENNESYLKAQFEKLSQRDMKKYLGEMKRLADGGEMNFDGYLDKMSHLVNEGTLDPDILSKMRDAAPQLISFAKSFDPTSKEEIKILTDTSKLIYDLFGVKSEK